MVGQQPFLLSDGQHCHFFIINFVVVVSTVFAVISN